jgi:uncharacterized membrane protein YpjA
MDNFIKYLLILLNLFGFLLGLNAYLSQLNSTNPLFWFFVIDCPLAALFYIIFLFGLRNPYFEALTRAYAFKYSVWTWVVTLSSQSLLSYELAGVNLLLHLGLFIESFLFMKKKLEFKHFMPALVILLLNDASDYFLFTHPVLNQELFFPIMIFTFSLSVITIKIFNIIYKKRIISS